eukprot:5855637-Pyramimonas_sp.AAC.1
MHFWKTTGLPLRASMDFWALRSHTTNIYICQKEGSGSTRPEFRRGPGPGRAPAHARHRRVGSLLN